ncbi:MAG TPA: Gfo/Idh/MocA family oxidoreductase [Polyangia bacterium]
MSSSKPSRRDLIKGAGAATLSAAFWYPSGKVLGANDRVNIAVVGIRNQGGGHIKDFPTLPNVTLKTLCDIDENTFAERVALVEKTFNYKPGTATDMRRVFDDKDIHAVTFATPNHWHALGAIWAAQAGKHVYVEKPVSWSVWEGRQMVHAARKHKVLMQAGFQNRSRATTIAAMEFLHAGKIGKVYKARGLCFKPRISIGRYPDGPMASDAKPIPMVNNKQPFTAAYLEKVHYDHWAGPAPARPFNPNRFHYNWHWQFEYGGGDTANQGPHQFDVGRWGLNKEEGPVKVSSTGNLFLFKDSQQDTPNSQSSVLEYADGTIFEFDTRGLFTNPEGMIRIGVIFYGTEGRLEIDADGNWKTYFGAKDEPGPDSRTIKEERSNALGLVGTGALAHYRNFIDAVKANKQELLTCDIEVGHRSTILPLITNIAYRQGRALKWDGKKEQFVGDRDANKLLRRAADRKGFVVPTLGGIGTA